MRLFGSRKTPPPPEPSEEEGAPPGGPTIAEMLNHQEVRIYPQAAKFLWFYYAPDDRGKSEGRAKEFPGPIDDIASDCVRELQKLKLIEVVPTFSDFGVTAKLTGLGLQVMAAQSAPDHWNPVVITDPQSNVVTTYTQVRLGFP